MNASTRLVALAGGLMSLTAIILAALGSHLIDMHGLQSIWQTALNIHMFNAAALLGLAALLAHTQSRAQSRAQSRVLNWGAWLIVAGSVVFCGSIYLHVTAGFQLSAVAPTGGVLMMAGWFLVVLAFARKS